MARSNWRRPPLEPIAEGKRRIRMTVSYQGPHYNGWQKQTNSHAVTQEIEDAIHTITGETVLVVGSGRTDSGVHAIGQVCHFDLSNQKIKGEAFALALNRLLPPDIRILSSSQVDGTFHARYTSMARMYRYYFKEERDMTPFDIQQVGKVRNFPDLELLNQYAEVLKGTHDFTTFTASKDCCESKVRDIYESYWAYETDRFGSRVLTYTICGNAFLYKMVRSLVGSMMEFANTKMEKARFAEIFASKDRSLAGRTASPWGLYLYRISYDEEEYAWFEEQSNE